MVKLFRFYKLRYLILLLAFYLSEAAATELMFPSLQSCMPGNRDASSCSVVLDNNGYVVDSISGKKLSDTAESMGALNSYELYRDGSRYILANENYSRAKTRRWVVFGYEDGKVILKRIYIFSLDISEQSGPYWHGYECRPDSRAFASLSGQSFSESAMGALCGDVEGEVVLIKDDAPSSAPAKSLAVSVPVYNARQRNDAATYVFVGSDEPDLSTMVCHSNCSPLAQEQPVPQMRKTAKPALLCDERSAAVFQCELKSGKSLALCAARDSVGEIKGLQYRFGREGKVELVYPSVMDSSLEKFTVNHYVRYRVDYVRVAFDSGPYNYSVVRNVDEVDDQKPRVGAGVTVIKRAGDAKEINLACARIIKDDLPVLFNKLPCDSGDALGCDVR